MGVSGGTGAGLSREPLSLLPQGSGGAPAAGSGALLLGAAGGGGATRWTGLLLRGLFRGPGGRAGLMEHWSRGFSWVPEANRLGCYTDNTPSSPQDK